MAKLMWICGILLCAAGIAIGFLVLVLPLPAAAISFDSAAILLVGGILSVGLGCVIDTLRTLPAIPAEAYGAEPREAEAPAAAAAPIPEFGPRPGKSAAAAAAAIPEVSEPTRDTIQALEQARQKIEQAFDTKKPAAEEPPLPEAAPLEEEEEVVEEVTIEEEAVDDGQLYVVEERVIRRHPARILSDGTVEAETAEGWMRFENLEHLDEYLDATEPA